MLKKVRDRIFDSIISDSEWLIEQNTWQESFQQAKESQFTLGNGIIGSRGILEELPYDANAGTYVAGIYDRFGAQIPELVNLPNPIVFKADVNGEKLDPKAMEVVKHYRALDMKKGLLARETLYKTAHGKKVNYQSYRFISMYQKYIGAMVVAITPMDSAMTFNIQSVIDTSVCNRGLLTEGRKRHFEVTAVSTEKKANYTEVRTLEHHYDIGYASSLEIERNNHREITTDRTFKVRIRKGETVRFIKYFTIIPSFYVQNKRVKTMALSELRRGKKLGINRLFQAHEKAWKRLWNSSDITIEKSGFIQKALRFNIYHLLIAGNTDDRVSIGARTLSGEGYRGHIFWDAETFILPFFVYTNPKIAKSMLVYRWKRLDHAYKIAHAKGYEGALFPWESADTGEETTPSWFKDMSGEIQKIKTLDQEHHINSDVAYAVNQYVNATGEETFMTNYGIELLIQTARFWVSRSIHNKKKDRYEIHHAMGPDEFHADIDNSAFTNAMAAFNLKIAAKWTMWARGRGVKKFSRLAKRINLTTKEIMKWDKIASKMYIPYSKKKKIIETFDGYLKLKDVRIKALDKHFMPVVPPGALPVEEGNTQLLKQADVVMLMYLLKQDYSLDEIKRNYNYYEKRTLHKSSLSPAVHSIMAAKIGDVEKALTYLTVALQADLNDIHGNASEGFHAASGGGVWQAMVMGFGGMEVADNNLIFSPLIPKEWKSLSFRLQWQGSTLEIKITSDEINILRRSEGKQKRLIVEVGGVKQVIPIRKKLTFSYRSVDKKIISA